MVFELFSLASHIFSSYPYQEKFNQAMILNETEGSIGQFNSRPKKGSAILNLA